MTLSDLASIATVVSGLAVLGSLIYLSLQTRQNTKHTRALIHQGRVEIAMDYIISFISDEATAATVLRGREGDETLNDAQISRFIGYQVAYIYSCEDIFLQHQEGLIADGRHTGTALRLKQSFSQPGFRAVWKMIRDTFDSDFQSFMNDLMAEGSAIPARNTAATWKSIVRAELTGSSA